jgi:hypothetical protein
MPLPVSCAPDPAHPPADLGPLTTDPAMPSQVPAASPLTPAPAPTKPVPASIILENLLRQRRGRLDGRVKSGIQELDDYVLQGGIDSGVVVGISGDGDGDLGVGVGRLVSFWWCFLVIHGHFLLGLFEFVRLLALE